MKPGIERLKTQLEQVGNIGKTIEILNYDGPVFIKSRNPKRKERDKQ